MSSAVSERSDFASDAESLGTGGFAGISNTPSLEDIRIVSCVEEIVLRDRTPESEISSSSSITLGRKNSEELGGFQERRGDGIEVGGMARDVFSGRTIFVDALEHNDSEQYSEEQREREDDDRDGNEVNDREDRGVLRYDTMKSVYVDALEHETIELNQTMEIAVVAEIHEGRTSIPQRISSPLKLFSEIAVKISPVSLFSLISDFVPMLI